MRRDTDPLKMRILAIIAGKLLELAEVKTEGLGNIKYIIEVRDK